MKQRRFGVARGISADGIGRVNLPDIEKRVDAAAKGCEGTVTVLTHAHCLIPHRPAHVEGSPGLRADAALPRKDGVSHFSGKEVERVIA